MNDIVAVGKRKQRSENQRLSEERMTLAEMVMSMQPLSRSSHTWKMFWEQGGEAHEVRRKESSPG